MKNSSSKKTVCRLSADCWLYVGQLSVICWPTVGRLLAVCRPNAGCLSPDRFLAKAQTTCNRLRDDWQSLDGGLYSIINKYNNYCNFLFIIRLSTQLEEAESCLCPIIPKYTPIPSRRTHNFTTSVDNQVCGSVWTLLVSRSALKVSLKIHLIYKICLGPSQ